MIEKMCRGERCGGGVASLRGHQPLGLRVNAAVERVVGQGVARV